MSENLIIIPGWEGSQKTWQKFADLASKNFDVQIIELPCFGNEPCPGQVWGVEEYADFVKKKLNPSTHQPINILGHSFGGSVATHLVASNPEICQKLILSGAAIFRRKKVSKSCCLEF